MSKAFDYKVVWITGGSAGIGREMALEFARQGARVAVSGRRANRLEVVVTEIEQLGGEGLAVPCDVADEQDVEQAVKAVVNHFGQLDVAVANAGFGVSGKVVELGADDWRRQFDVNVVGAAITARHAIPELQKTRGRLALTGSVAGMMASPGAGAYHASKYALRALGQVLSLELADSGVTCTTIHPGFVESEIAQVDNEGNFREDWTDRRPQVLMWPTDKAAKVMVKAIRKRKREYVFTAHGKAAAFLGKHAPGVLHFAMTKFG
jgi:NAD(P)-dependent dehydrogenase (short-subunit alcohol dehydrogenase family)